MEEAERRPAIEPVVGEVLVAPNGDVVIGAPTAVAVVVLPEVSK